MQFDSFTLSTTAIVSFTICVIIGIVLYMNPRFFYKMMTCGKQEGFTVIAISSEEMPKCFARDADAQELLQMTRGMLGADAESKRLFEEFKLILQKILCIDADVTGMGMGAYSTYMIPFNTLHDMEPAASLVGRCLRNAVNERDLALVQDKFEMRGTEILQHICMEPSLKIKAITLFHGILSRSFGHIRANCLKEHASMDIPPGVRDPGYYTDPALLQLAEYKETA
jgi:hypothetical protein